MDQVKAMQVFRAVAECRSFAQAAEQLDLPRPTVTHVVQRLERELGARLLQRTTRKVSLTAEGELYLDRAQRVLAELDEMSALFAGQQGGPRGTVRVDLPERFARMTVIPRLPEFFARYPHIHLRLGASDRFADLVGEGIDVAIRVGPLRDSSLVARRLGLMEQVNVAAPSYLAQFGVPQTPDDLGKHLAVQYFSSRQGRELDWEYVQDGAVQTQQMRGCISVASAEAYLAACVAGLGLIQAPRRGLENLLASGELVEVMPDYRAPPLPISAVMPHQRHIPARVRAFADWIAELV